MNTEQTIESVPPWWMRLLVGRRPVRTLVRIVILIGLAIFTFKILLVPIRIQGISMLPTYHDGNINFINRWAYRWKPIQRGDIVGVQFAGIHVMLLKRVIGLPGEQVMIKRGTVYIDGEALNEPYIKLRREPWNRLPVTLQPNQYLVIGDNRTMPIENHRLAEVDIHKIVGKILF